MSLINQVLQELEKRHASDPGVASLPPQVRAVRMVAPASMRLLVIALILVSLGVGAYVYLGGEWGPVPTTHRGATSLPIKKQTSSLDKATQTVVVPNTAADQAPADISALPAPLETAVQAVLLAPVSRLSEELSFRPKPRAQADRAAKPKIAARAAKARTVKPAPTLPPSDSAPVAAPVVADLPSSANAADSATTAALEPAAEENTSAIDKQMREMSVQQRAETAFRSGAAQLQDGRISAAESSFREALKVDPLHGGARQALLGLLLDGGRNDEAEQLLRRALALNPRQPRHAMVLARLEIDRGEVGGAIDTLVAALPFVRSDPEYFAFLAALFQRDGRHKDAVDYYRTALQSSPGNPVWLMGLGMSLRAGSQFADAREAFQRAADSKQLNPELQAFVERQLREMAPKK